MNPIAIRLFDISRDMIITRFLDMCITEGNILYSQVHVGLRE